MTADLSMKTKRLSLGKLRHRRTLETQGAFCGAKASRIPVEITSAAATSTVHYFTLAAAGLQHSQADKL